jgi:amino acid transporter
MPPRGFVVSTLPPKFRHHLLTTVVKKITIIAYNMINLFKVRGTKDMIPSDRQEKRLIIVCIVAAVIMLLSLIRTAFKIF